MKKLLTLLTLVLSLTFCFSSTALASNLGGDYNGGGEDGGVGTHDGVYEGITPARSGYIIWLSDASGRSINGVVVCATADGSEPHTKTGAPLLKLLRTRFGENVTRYDTLPVPWSVPPFTSANTSNEGAVKAFLTSPQPQLNDSESGADWVCINYLGISKEQLDAYKEQYEELYLNVSPWAVGGVYGGGGANSYKGYCIAGNDVVWAAFTDSNNYLSRYTHGTLSNSFHYVESWLGLAVPSSVTGKHSSGEILQRVGWGIVSVRVKEGDKQIVKVYKTDGVVDRTSYSMTSAPVDVKNEGDYIVKKWHTSEKKTKSNDTKSDYPPFVSECPPVQSGSGPTTVDMPPSEKAIFILLEREKEVAPVVLNQESIRAHELNYLFRYSDGLRDEFNGKNGRFEGANFKFTDVIPLYEVFDNEPDYLVKNWRTEDTYKVIEDYI